MSTSDRDWAYETREPQSRIEYLIEEIDEEIKNHWVAGANIIFTNNSDGTVTVSASGEVSSEDTVARGTIAAHKANTSNPHSVTKAQIGLGNVDNTSDMDKPVSTAVQTALDTKPSSSDIYSLSRRSCHYINNNASGEWAKIADMTTTATSMQHRTLVLLMVQSYLGTSEQAYESSNGILQVKIRAMGSGFDRGRLEWLVAESGIDVSNFVLVYKNNGDNCTMELWCRNAAQTLTYTFTVLADVNKGSGVDSQYWTLHDSTTGVSAYDSGDGVITSTVSKLLQVE